MNIGVVVGIFPKRAYSFIHCLDGSKVFLAKNDWQEPLTNGTLIAFEVEQELRGPRARRARKATVADTAGARQIGSILSFDPDYGTGRLCTPDGVIYGFREQDISDECAELWDRQPVSFVGQESSMGRKYAFLLAPVEAVTPQEVAA